MAFENLPHEKQTDYDAAERLAQGPGLRNRMGPRFATIVRKCLSCDFGLGENDLSNEQLQGVFFVDVIVALREVGIGLADGFGETTRRRLTYTQAIVAICFCEYGK